MSEMVQLTVMTAGQIHGTFRVPAGKRLVNALEDEAGIDQMHACGGFAKCTTCRVRVIENEPARMTEAERAIFEEKDITREGGMRLSCQLLCEQDMTVEVISRVSDTSRTDPGARCADEIEPEPVWTDA